MGTCLSGLVKTERSVVTATKSARGNIMRQRIGADIEKYYAIESTIGRGSIGNVCRCRHMATNKVYALKTIKTSRMSKEMVDELMNEIEILMSLDHPNVVRPIELFSRRREIYLIMQLCTGGDLYKRAPYSENEAARIVAMIVDVVDYIHANKVVHRDIKFENVLFVSKAADSEIMVIDFGLAKANYAAKREGKLDEFVGTLYSMAPEVIRGSYDEKCDIWSLGVVSYMLLAGAMPFTRFDDERKFLRDLESQRYDMHRRPIAKRSEEAKNFVRSLLIANPQKRPSAAKVKKHPWIKHRRRGASLRGTGGENGGDSIRKQATSKNGGNPGGAAENSSSEGGAAENSSDRSSGRDASASSSGGNKSAATTNDKQNPTTPATPESRLSESYSEDNVAESLASYAASSDLRKIALMVVAHRSDNEALREIRQAFRAIDTNSEGFINFDELRVVLERAHYDQETVQQIFNAVDHDGTGVISYTEFIAACLEGTTIIQEDQLAEAFDRLDADDSGFISKENLRDILGNQFSPELVDEMIKEGDFKQTGHIDFEEFMAFMRGKRVERLQDADARSRTMADAMPPKKKKQQSSSSGGGGGKKSDKASSSSSSSSSWNNNKKKRASK